MKMFLLFATDYVFKNNSTIASELASEEFYIDSISESIIDICNTTPKIWITAVMAMRSLLKSKIIDQSDECDYEWICLTGKYIEVINTYICNGDDKFTLCDQEFFKIHDLITNMQVDGYNPDDECMEDFGIRNIICSENPSMETYVVEMFSSLFKLFTGIQIIRLNPDFNDEITHLYPVLDIIYQIHTESLTLNQFLNTKNTLPIDITDIDAELLTHSSYSDSIVKMLSLLLHPGSMCKHAVR
jgi:hypothetical protein